MVFFLIVLEDKLGFLRNKFLNKYHFKILKNIHRKNDNNKNEKTEKKDSIKSISPQENIDNIQVLFYFILILIYLIL